MEERRQHPRIGKILPIKLSVSEFDILTETHNISASGAYLSLTRPLELMTKLKIILLIPLKKSKSKVIEKINCTGIVVRCKLIDKEARQPYRAAMYFNDLTERDRKILRSYINPLLKA